MVYLGLVLQATGLKMLVVDDREALAKVQPMFEARALKQVQLGNRSATTTRKNSKKRKKVRRISLPAPQRRGGKYG